MKMRFGVSAHTEASEARSDLRVPALDLEVPGLLSIATFALG
jgi:hypothetical protein